MDTTDKQDEEHITRRGIDLGYKINFDEPIPDIIARLKKEHRQIESRLAELESIGAVNERSLKILHELAEPIVQHAVEEEAVVMRVIMHKARDQSGESVKIAQEHNWIVDFVKKTIPKLAAMPQKEAVQKTNEFIQNLRTHFSEEEEIMFPLALSANSLRT